MAVYVIEKYHERDSEGKQRVQHRIKGLYFIFKNIKPCSTKAAMVTWEDLVNGWFTGIKKEKEALRSVQSFVKQIIRMDAMGPTTVAMKTIAVGNRYCIFNVKQLLMVVNVKKINVHLGMAV